MKKNKRNWLILFTISLILIVLSILIFFVLLHQKALSPISNRKIVEELPEPEVETYDVSNSVSFAIAGDMMFDRNVDFNFRGENIYQIFDNFDKKIFTGRDLAFGNLEGPVSLNAIPADNSGSMSFYFPPKTIEVLKWLGLNAVSLANNHSNNQGKTALENTKKLLSSNNIIPVGEEVKFDPEISIKSFGVNTEKLTVIAINCLENNSDLTAVIKKEKSLGNYVLIYPHWGVEYESVHSSAQEALSHRWIDAGADLVIGSHPHVIQDAEIYKNRPIFYSLGNFVFDQTFSKETQRGLIITGEIDEENLIINVLPTISKNMKPELLSGQELTDRLLLLKKQMKLETGGDSIIFNFKERK